VARRLVGIHRVEHLDRVFDRAGKMVPLLIAVCAAGREGIPGS